MSGDLRPIASRPGGEPGAQRERGVRTLTARARSRRVPRHEADLPAQEGQAKPDPWLFEAIEVSRRQKRPQATKGQGAKAAHAECREEVSGRSGVRLGKPARLTLRREFLAVQERGRKVQAGAYLALALPNALGRPRIGVTVPKRIGTAVVRNRVKRWVREAFRAGASRLPAVDLVLVARPGAPSGGKGAAERAIAAARSLWGPP